MREESDERLRDEREIMWEEGEKREWYMREIGERKGGTLSV